MHSQKNKKYVIQLHVSGVSEVCVQILLSIPKDIPPILRNK